MRKPSSQNPDFITVSQAVNLGFATKHAIYLLANKGEVRTSKYRGHTLCVNREDLEAAIANPTGSASAGKPDGSSGE